MEIPERQTREQDIKVGPDASRVGCNPKGLGTRQEHDVSKMLEMLSLE